MARSVTQFNRELYSEHLDEASFLYDQRLAYLVDPEVNWPDLHNWEERAEAHIDALALGGDLARRVCLQRAAEGDHGEIHAAIRVLCRQGRKTEVFSILAALDDASEDAIRAAAEAMCREAPSRWQGEMAGGLQSSPKHLTRILSRVIGYRRFPLEELLRTRLQTATGGERAEQAWALGRIGTAQSVQVLSRLMSEDDETVREASAIALLRLGDQRPLAVAENAASTQPWARRVLAIAGGSRVTPVLLDALGRGPGQADTVIALGLLGDLAAVVPLLELLDHEELSESAAIALNTITGADLREIAFVQDPIDRDELSDGERAALVRDDVEPGPTGRIYGTNVRRPLMDKIGWRAWLEENKHRFNRRSRWRMGMVHGPTAIVACLQNATTPHAVRAAAYEELVIRFGLDIPFEVDLPVVHQRRILQRIGEWAAQHENGVTDGA